MTIIPGTEKPFLTRRDIADILQISTKQAGRIMGKMPTVRIGRSHRRVMASDFEEWVTSEREMHPTSRLAQSNKRQEIRQSVTKVRDLAFKMHKNR